MRSSCASTEVCQGYSGGDGDFRRRRRCVAAGLLALVGTALLPGAGRAADPEPAVIAAAKRGDLAAVESLLDGGADPNAHDSVANTALIFAARDGRLTIARLLLQRGARVNWVDAEGVTPLILAAFKGHLALVELLLAAGADRGLRDQWGRRAIDYALRRGTADPIAVKLARP